MCYRSGGHSSGYTVDTREAPERDYPIVLAFFSNRLGCLGSLLVALVGTVVLILLLRACTAYW